MANKIDVEELILKVSEYKKLMMSPGFDPFGKENAYWAAGMEYFLKWLKHNKKET